MENFKHNLNNINWDNKVYSTNDPNVAYENFYDEIYNTYLQSFPLVKLSRRGTKDKKWVTIGIKTFSAHKNSLYRIWLTTKKTKDEQRYKQYKKVFTHLLKAAETNYYGEIFNANSNSKSIGLTQAVSISRHLHVVWVGNTGPCERPVAKPGGNTWGRQRKATPEKPFPRKHGRSKSDIDMSTGEWALPEDRRWTESYSG